MENRLILESKTSIVYFISIGVFGFFGVIAEMLLSHGDEIWTIVIQILLGIIYIFYVLDVIYSNRKISFYSTYLEVQYKMSGNIIRIDYNQFTSLDYNPELVKSGFVWSMSSENGVIKLKADNGKSLTFSEMQYENFATMRLLLQEVIRGEFNQDEWY